MKPPVWVLHETVLALHEQLLAEFGRRAPAGPTLTAEAVADAVYLLCLPEAGMITGHTLVVDGGYCISG